MDYWAERKPGEAAIVNATRGTTLTWLQLQRGSTALANELRRRGFRAGDYLGASLPLLDAHILLEYACFRLGAIHVPLDLRLPPAEVIRSPGLVRAKGYFFPGKTTAADFAALGEAVRRAILARYGMHRRRRQFLGMDARRRMPAGGRVSRPCEPGTMPMNRTAIVNVTRLRQLARDEVGKLRERGRWDG